MFPFIFFRSPGPKDFVLSSLVCRLLAIFFKHFDFIFLETTIPNGTKFSINATWMVRNAGRMPS